MSTLKMKHIKSFYMNQSDEKVAINKHLSEKLLKITTNVNFFLVSNDP